MIAVYNAYLPHLLSVMVYYGIIILRGPIPRATVFWHRVYRERTLSISRHTILPHRNMRSTCTKRDVAIGVCKIQLNTLGGGGVS